jgi:hypothetical protein
MLPALFTERSEQAVVTRGLTIAFVALSTLTCCQTSRIVAPYAIVREGQFRTEKTAADRIGLPLQAKGRDRILQYLRAGGNAQLYRKGIADLNAESHYRSLLFLLSRPLTIDDLARPEFQKYFPNGPVYQVIDARERFPLSDTQVVAVSDGVYWWIFYHSASKRLEQVLLTRAVGTRPTD